MKKFLLILCFAFMLRPARGAAGTEYKEMKLFNDVLSQIETNYVEEKKVPELVEGAVIGMVKTLDPYSQYLTPAEAQIMKSETQGEFGGLGIKITVRDKYLTIITPMPGTPAFRAGLLPEDKIIKIEGESTESITIMDAIKKLRGEPGTRVTITIARDAETKDVTIERAKIKIESVPKKKSQMLENSIGYIGITEFNEKTPDDFSKAYAELENSGMKALIVDLRNNPGGLLKSAVAVAEHFLEKDQLIVYTTGRRKDTNFKFIAQKNTHKKIPLVLLINNGSASGSEIVAGAIKDLGKGILLGEKTFGKGSVQSLIDISGGSQLRLTTAKYYTPNGICIHEKGIVPDIEVKISREDKIKLMQQEEEIYGLSPEEKEKKEKEKIKDAQLERAREILFAELKFSGELSVK